MGFHAVAEYYPGNTDDLHPDEVSWFTSEEEAIAWAKSAVDESGSRALVLKLEAEFEAAARSPESVYGVRPGVDFPATLGRRVA